MKNIIVIICLMLGACCTPTYLTPAESYNERHEVKCNGKTYAQCINMFAEANSKYNKQLDKIYVKETK